MKKLRKKKKISLEKKELKNLLKLSKSILSDDEFDIKKLISAFKLSIS